MTNFFKLFVQPYKPLPFYETTEFPKFLRGCREQILKSCYLRGKIFRKKKYRIQYLLIKKKRKRKKDSSQDVEFQTEIKIYIFCCNLMKVSYKYINFQKNKICVQVLKEGRESKNQHAKVWLKLTQKTFLLPLLKYIFMIFLAISCIFTLQIKLFKGILFLFF